MAKDIVLIVDDEPIILRACSMAVAQAGFRCVVAENGAAGLEAYTMLRDEICLVLSDIIMPAMNGITLAESIKRLNPDVTILLMSAYSDNVIEQQGRNRLPFIRKPFINHVLIEKIRATIKSAGSSASQG